MEGWKDVNGGIEGEVKFRMNEVGRVCLSVNHLAQVQREGCMRE